MTAQPFAGLAPREADALRALGPRWADDIETHRRQVVEIYTPHLARACREGILVDTGLAYGAHPRQRLDLYRSAATPARGAPMAVFVHGGAFVRGSMNSNAEIYGNVTRWLARQGWLAANVEYRLAPEARYPEGARDVGLALDWLRRHAEDYGGDPRCVVLIGHSAGGAHVAGYAIDPATCPTSGRGPEPESNRQPETARRSAPERASERAPERAPAPVPEPAHWPASCAQAQDGLAGLVLISARLRADARTHNPNAHGVRAYWGDDESRYDAVSPVSHAHRLRIPALVAVAAHENPYLDAYGAEFVHRALEAGVPDVQFIRVPQHNHTSIVAHLDTPDQSFAPALAAFLGMCRDRVQTFKETT